MGGYSCHSPTFKTLMTLYSDLYAVIKDETILPPDHHLPAEYPPVGQRKLDRPSTIEDVCDFVIEYIDSDILVCPQCFSASALLISSRCLGTTFRQASDNSR